MMHLLEQCHDCTLSFELEDLHDFLGVKRCDTCHTAHQEGLERLRADLEKQEIAKDLGILDFELEEAIDNQVLLMQQTRIEHSQEAIRLHEEIIDSALEAIQKINRKRINTP